jgi:acetyl esterase/lipase
MRADLLFAHGPVHHVRTSTYKTSEVPAAGVCVMRVVGFLAAAALSAAAVTAASAALAEASVVDADVASTVVLEDRYPRAVVDFQDNVAGYPDLVYATPPGFRPLRLDLYRPRQVPKDSTGFPLVVYVHGGGWQSGHTRHAGAFSNWPEVLASLAARGYVVASIEYRLSQEAKFPAAIQDVKTAVRWLRSRSVDFSIDRKRAVLWGGSAGGQLAALAATSCGDEALAPVIPVDGKSDSPSSVATESDCVDGLVAWYGVFDLATSPPLSGAKMETADSPVSKYLGCLPSVCANKVSLASPVAHVDAHTPPTLLIHGEVDQVVPVEQSRAFYAVLKSRSVPAELIIIPGVDHSFIGSNATETRKASQDALSKTFEFIDATLKRRHP